MAGEKDAGHLHSLLRDLRPSPKIFYDDPFQLGSYTALYQMPNKESSVDRDECIQCAQVSLFATPVASTIPRNSIVIHKTSVWYCRVQLQAILTFLIVHQLSQHQKQQTYKRSGRV